nr:MAG TPA: hypothetical protein [Caudoviricetes sp.]
MICQPSIFDGWYFYVIFKSCYIGFQCLCNNFSSVIHATIHNDLDNNRIIKKVSS